jgi:hypothetical protein
MVFFLPKKSQQARGIGAPVGGPSGPAAAVLASLPANAPTPAAPHLAGEPEETTGGHGRGSMEDTCLT